MVLVRCLCENGEVLVREIGDGGVEHLVYRLAKMNICIQYIYIYIYIYTYKYYTYDTYA